MPLFRNICLTASCLILALASPAVATGLPDSCDADMMELMKVNAWKGGQRDVEMAQRIILKPDSVLEYTCFDKEYEKVVAPGSAGEKILKPVYLGFLGGSFGATYGGGTYTGAGAGANCEVMDLIWDFLKCENFGDGNFASDPAQPGYDFFWTFEQLAGHDPRNEPVSCNDPGRAPKWDAAVNASDISVIRADTGP